MTKPSRHATVARKWRHPNGNLRDPVAWSDRFGMEMTWEISGAYASWTMTVTVGPPDHDFHEYHDNWRKEPIERLQQHFVDVVNLLELGRQMSNTPTYHFSGT